MDESRRKWEAPGLRPLADVPAARNAAGPGSDQMAYAGVSVDG